MKGLPRYTQSFDGSPEGTHSNSQLKTKTKETNGAHSPQQWRRVIGQWRWCCGEVGGRCYHCVAAVHRPTCSQHPMNSNPEHAKDGSPHSAFANLSWLTSLRGCGRTVHPTQYRLMSSGTGHWALGAIRCGPETGPCNISGHCQNGCLVSTGRSTRHPCDDREEECTTAMLIGQ